MRAIRRWAAVWVVTPFAICGATLFPICWSASASRDSSGR